MRIGALGLLPYIMSGCIALEYTPGEPDSIASQQAALGSAAGGGAGGASQVDGNAYVEPKTGDAVYSYSFDVPPGRDGMQPGLSLSYTSSGGNSDVGRGWILGGLSSIERDTRRGAASFGPSDRFLYRVSGSLQPLIYVGDLVVGDTREYRLANDSDDVRFEYTPRLDTWTVRTRAGVASTYISGVHRRTTASVPDPSVRQSLSWVVRNQIDENGNVVEYEYSIPIKVRPGATDATEMQVPRLSKVLYGGNTTGVPHLFEILIARSGHVVDPSMRSYAPPPRPADCFSRASTDPTIERQARVDYRAGGALYPDGEDQYIWGIAVRAYGAGTTDRRARERASNLTAMYRLTYNWDEVGCFNSNELHQTLRSIEKFQIGEAGEIYDTPAVTFEYGGWDRTFKTAVATLPVGFPISPADTNAPWFPPQLSTGLTQSTGEFKQSEPTHRIAGYSPARITNDTGFGASMTPERTWLDVDSDGRPDFVDMTQSAVCYDQGTRQRGVWYRWNGTGFDAARETPWDAPSHFACGLTQDIAARDNSYKINDIYPTFCRSWSGEALFPQTLVDSPLANLQFSDLLFVDADSDGYMDLLSAQRGKNWGSPAWSWYRQTPGSAGQLEAAQTIGNAFPWVTTSFYAHLNHTPDTFTCTASNQLQYAARQANDRLRTLAGEGRGALSAQTSWSRVFNGRFRVNEYRPVYIVSSQSRSNGNLADFNGDGLLDRAAFVQDNQTLVGGFPSIAFVVYPGIAPGQFGPAVRFAEVDQTDWRTDPSGQSLWANGSNSWGGTPDFVGLDVQTAADGDPDPDRFVPMQRRGWSLARAMDLNGDGFLDFVRNASHPVLTATEQWQLTAAGSSTRPTAYWNYGQGAKQNAALDTGLAVSALARKETQRHTEASCWNIKGDATLNNPDCKYDETVGVYDTFDFNGDGFVDVVSAEGWIQYGTGAGFTYPMVFAPTGLTTPFREVVHTSAGSELASQKQMIVDLTGDGRPELLVLGAGNTFTYFTDANPGEAPGVLKRVVGERGDSTEFEYGPMASVLGPADKGIPAKRWVVKKITQALAGRAAIATSFGYRTPKLLRSQEKDGAGNPLTWPASFRGFEYSTVCRQDTTRTENYYDYSQLVTGLKVRERAHGAGAAGLSGCEPYTGDSSMLRTDTTYEYNVANAQTTAGDGPLLYANIRRVLGVTRDPSSSRSLSRETLYTYGTVNGRRVLTDARSSSVPFDPKETLYTHFEYSALARPVSAYRVLVKETTISDASYGLLAWQRNYYDARPFGVMEDFADSSGLNISRGNLTATERLIVPAISTQPPVALRTTLTLDTKGHVLAATNAGGKTSRTCWDRNGMFPVMWQMPDGRRYGQVVDYTDGQVLESFGPHGLSNAPLVCPKETAGVGGGRGVTPTLPVWKFVPKYAPSPRASVPAEPAAAPLAVKSDVSDDVPNAYDFISTASPSALEQLSVRMSSVAALPEPHRFFAYIDPWQRIRFPSGTADTTNFAESYVPGEGRPRAPTSRFFYDGRGRVTRTYASYQRGTDLRYALAQTSASFYSTLNNVDETRTVSGFALSAVLDPATSPQSVLRANPWGLVESNREVLDRSSAGVPTRYAEYTTNYDSLLRVTGTTGPAANGTIQTVGSVVARDDLGRPSRVRNALGNESSVQYGMRLDNAGRVRVFARNVDASGIVNEVEFDSLGRALRSLAFPASGETLEMTATYDGLGRLRKQTDQNGSVVTQSYDTSGQLLDVTQYASVSQLAAGQFLRRASYLYNSDGQVEYTRLEAPGTASRQTRNIYDSKGRLTQVSVPPSSTPGALANYGDTFYSYDDVPTSFGYGAIATIRTPAEDYTLTYDAMGRTSRVRYTVHATFAGALLSDQYARSFAYNLAGALTEERWEIGTKTDVLRYFYTPRGLVDRIEEQPSGGTARTLYRFSYYDAGSIRTATDVYGNVLSYQYDAVGTIRRKALARPTAALLWELTVSPYPNGTPQTIGQRDTAGKGPTLSSSYVYDGAMRLRSGTTTWTPVTGAATRHQFSATYAMNRMSASYDQFPSGAIRDVRYEYSTVDPSRLERVRSTAGALAAQQTYDALGSVASRGVPTATAHTLDPTQQLRETATGVYVYGASGDRTHAYAKSDGKVYARDASMYLEYTLSGGKYTRTTTTKRMGVVRTAFGTMGPAKYVLTDYQGSPAFVYSDTATSYTRYVFSPWGESLYGPKTGVLPEGEGFQSGWLDPTGSGLVTFGVRDYDPMTRKFTSTDPVATNDRYQFAGDNPIAFSDPTGYQTYTGGSTTVIDLGSGDMTNYQGGDGGWHGYSGNFQSQMRPVVNFTPGHHEAATQHHHHAAYRTPPHAAPQAPAQQAAPPTTSTAVEAAAPQAASQASPGSSPRELGDLSYSPGRSPRELGMRGIGATSPWSGNVLTDVGVAIMGTGEEIVRNPVHAIENGIFGGVGALAGFVCADLILGPVFEAVAPNSTLVEGFNTGRVVGAIGGLAMGWSVEVRAMALFNAGLRTVETTHLAVEAGDAFTRLVGETRRLAEAPSGFSASEIGAGWESVERARRAAAEARRLAMVERGPLSVNLTRDGGFLGHVESRSFGANRFTVTVHGSPNSASGWSVGELAELVATHPDFRPGMTVHLDACSTGRYANGYAQQFAEALAARSGVSSSVWAKNTDIVLSPLGEVVEAGDVYTRFVAGSPPTGALPTWGVGGGPPPLIFP